jgi:hypothetical protein
VLVTRTSAYLYDQKARFRFPSSLDTSERATARGRRSRAERRKTGPLAENGRSLTWGAARGGSAETGPVRRTLIVESTQSKRPKDGVKKIPMQHALRLNIALNAVLVTATSVIIAPSYAAQEHGSLVAGFFGGLLISAVLRTPGAYFEWYLARRTRQRRIYITHIITGLFTAFVVLSNHYTTGTDAVASAVGIYLFSSSIFLGLVALTTFVISLSRKRDHGAKLTHSGNRPTHPPGPAQAPAEAESGQERQVSLNVPTVAASGAANAPPSKESHDTSHTETKSTIALANRAALVLGIVTGIASLVQGYDAHDAYKTVVALAAGGIGLVVIYLPTLWQRR